MPEFDENTSLEIGRELAADVKGKIEISEIYGNSKEVRGRKVRLILQAVERVVAAESRVSEKEVTRIERGTKKELMELLS